MSGQATRAIRDPSQSSSDPMRLRRASLPSLRDCAATRVTRVARATRADDDDDIEALEREMQALALPATRPHDAWRSSPDPVGLPRSSQTPSRSLAATRATEAVGPTGGWG